MSEWEKGLPYTVHMLQIGFFELLEERCALGQEKEQIEYAQIVEKSRATKSSAYNYYKTVNPLVRDWAAAVIIDLAKVCKLTNTTDYKAHSESVFSYFLKYKQELYPLFKCGFGHFLTNAMHSFYLDCPENAKLDQEEKHTLSWNLAGMQSILENWIVNNMQESPKSLSSLHCKKVTLAKEREALMHPFN
jgi:hypothetical protein